MIEFQAEGRLPPKQIESARPPGAGLIDEVDSETLAQAALLKQVTFKFETHFLPNILLIQIKLTS